MNRPAAIGMEIFAGGFTVGVEKHFDVLAHLEISGYGSDVFRANRPGIPVFVNTHRWPVEHLAEMKPQFVYANPACAAWSVLGRRAHGRPDAWLTDPRVDCTRTCFAALEFFRPRAWIWESVPQAFVVGRPLVDQLTARAVRAGYSVSYLLHNAKYCGARQSRNRFFFVAHDVDMDWKSLPFHEPKTLGPLMEVMPDAVKGGPSGMKPKKAKRLARLLRHVKPGLSARRAWDEQVAKNPAAAAKLPKQRIGVGRTRLDACLGAIVGNTKVHPFEHRMFSPRELQWLGDYPDDWSFGAARLTHVPSLIARGVVPTVGAWIARHVAGAIARDSRTKPTVNVIHWSSPPGRVVPIAEWDDERAARRGTEAA